MKILLTGGGTGGHFYPLIAIAEKLTEIADEQKIIDLKLFYMSDKPFNKRMLFENNIKFIQVSTGKARRYKSIKNFFDIFNTISGLFFGLLNMFFVFPDVVISKGGYAAFPAVFAARILRIPVIIHESDSYPGRVNLWTAKFAKRIAISWPEAANYLPKDETALTGQPIRKSILNKNSNGAEKSFGLTSKLPVILVMGGSQGAEKINNIILDIIPEVLGSYQIIHQTGEKKFKEITLRSKLLLENNPNANNYHPVPYLSDLDMKMAAGVADLIISRAGSTIFEIANWGIPSIIIPITDSNGDHQRKNAYNYARSGACIVIGEQNLAPHILIDEINKLFTNKNILTEMSNKAKTFAKPEAAKKIAKEALGIALSHFK